jgi:hypothetical protein
MKTIVFAVGVALLSGPLSAQEMKPVPKNSVRVYIPGCSRGVVFTAGPRTEDRPGGSAVPAGMHLRMNGPKKTMAEIKGQEGSMIEITGLVRKGQLAPDGIALGGGVRVGPGPSSSGGGLVMNPGVNSVMIDVEGWRHIQGECPSR